MIHKVNRFSSTLLRPSVRIIQIGEYVYNLWLWQVIVYVAHVLA